MPFSSYYLYVLVNFEIIFLQNLYRSGGTPTQEEPSLRSQMIAALNRQLAAVDEHQVKVKKFLLRNLDELIEVRNSLKSLQETTRKLLNQNNEMRASNLEIQKRNGQLVIQLEQERNKNVFIRKTMADLADSWRNHRCHGSSLVFQMFV